MRFTSTSSSSALLYDIKLNFNDHLPTLTSWIWLQSASAQQQCAHTSVLNQKEREKAAAESNFHSSVKHKYI